MAHGFIKTASALTAAVMAVQLAAFAAIQREPEFPDLSNHWSKSVIMRLNSYGIINGYDDGTMRPEAYVSTAEFISIIIKSLGVGVEVSGSDWEGAYIRKAE